jgi:hypothetical protein
MSRQSTGLSRDEKRATASPQGRRFARIPGAVEHSGLSRSYLYVLARQNPGLFKKAGVATLVDLPLLDEILAASPPAILREPGERS